MMRNSERRRIERETKSRVNEKGVTGSLGRIESRIETCLPCTRVNCEYTFKLNTNLPFECSTLWSLLSDASNEIDRG